MTTSQPQLTVHHLQRGQSERILWLLEELSLSYHLVIHKRAPLLAPESLKAVSSQGVAPVLVDGDLTLSESMAIATWILNKHAPANPQSAAVASSLVPGPDSPNYAPYLYWLYFILTSVQPAQSCCMMAYFDQNLTDKPDSIAKAAPRGRLQKFLGMLEERLASSPYLAGEEFTLADLMALWPLAGARTFIPYSLARYPKVLAYVQKVAARPAYRKAMQKGDEGLPILDGAEPVERKAHF
ncbi:putative glutathione S-transferase [Jaminaea rosea]|uniref:Putative glutathione S-transferase n=1 Tax=Jaminaea rosea TaxID=1569628 RepID=A0A316USZ7_9BASI|nr:putative glutathione S-transferase [Jaminaea rosea]PWN28400.1 putative glutathione S-transferase [Jaminaea rosea]